MLERVVNSKSDKAIKAIDKKCNRCLSQNIICDHNQHYYCQDCYNNRLISDHLYLVREKRKRKFKDHKLDIRFSLSKFQLEGSKFIYDSYKRKEKVYLHAVCGAGKTEMTLKTILTSLNNKESIAFVIPRVEIIKQLYVRFTSYFPKSKICAMYQGMIFDEEADIIITTPQQLIHFYQEFDLMIIDEVDAFPYYKNIYLQRLVNKALNRKSVLVYISATIPDDYKLMIKKEKMNYKLISSRFHHKDLIIPSFKKYNYIYTKRLIMDVSYYLDSKKKLMIYFPSIHLMTRYKWFLEKNNIPSQMISSKSQHKSQIIKNFNHFDSKILLTTSILERGVTFSNCDVYVFESDHKIFDRDTLIQIAGRVGRDPLYTEGQLIFYSRFISQEMKKAKNELIKMNRIKNHDMQIM